MPQHLLKGEVCLLFGAKMLVDFGAEGAFAVAGPDVDDLGFRGDQDEMRDAVYLIGGGKARAHRLEFIPLYTI